MNLLAPLNCNKNEIRNGVVQNLAAAPSSPVAGQVYYDTVLGKFQGRGASAWFDMSLVASATPTATTIPIANGSGKLAAGWLQEVLAIADLSDISGVTGSGTINVLSVNPSITKPTLVAQTGVSMDAGNGTIQNLAAPTNASDAARLADVTNIKAGLDVKDSVRVASTANVTVAAPGAAIDGITLATNDRVLLKNQTTTSENGLYVFNGSATPMTRSTDGTQGNLTSETFVFVEDGTANAATQWRVTTLNPITVGTTGITFAQFGAGTAYTSGTGITVAGSVISINAAYVGQSTITTLGTITTGVWTGTSIAVLNGGTGATTAAGARTNLGAVGKAAGDIGNGSLTSIDFAHNLNTVDIIVQVWDKLSPPNLVLCDAQAKDVNTVTLIFTVAPTATQYRVVVTG